MTGKTLAMILYVCVDSVERALAAEKGGRYRARAEELRIN